MQRVQPHPPEPLLSFGILAGKLNAELMRVDSAHTRYIEHNNAGKVLPNSIEAIRLELTYHSNAIEGNTLSLRETQLVLEGQTPPGAKPLREIYEARNHDRALREIEARSLSSPPPLTERDVLDIHALVLADIDPTYAGRLRSDRVLIKGTRYIPPGSHKFPSLVPAMLELANTPGVHPALQAAELHYNLVAIHPFGDGNGRTARLLMNYILLRRGYPLTVIPVERRAEYLAALESANTGRPEPFATFIADCTVRSIERLIGAP